MALGKFRSAKALLYRYIFQHLTVRTVIGFIVVYSLLKTLNYGAVYYKNFQRFYVKVSEIREVVSSARDPKKPPATQANWTF